jgi:hypothetical protein
VNTFVVNGTLVGNRGCFPHHPTSKLSPIENIVPTPWSRLRLHKPFTGPSTISHSATRGHHCEWSHNSIVPLTTDMPSALF